MKVILATDHSPLSDEAAWLTARIPFQKPIDLKILNVISTPHMPAAVGMHPAWPRIIETLEKEAHESNATLADKFRAFDGDVNSVVRRGNPAEEIIDEAESSEADLVILGATGHSALDRALLGSVSDRVATHAPCSAFIVRPTGLATSAQRPLRVLIAHDGSEPSWNAVNEVSNLDFGPSTDIKLVHVMQTIDAYHIDVAQSISEVWDKERENAEADLATIAKKYAERGLTVATEVRVASHAGEEICQRAKDFGADIVVVGDRGYGAVRRFVLGSVSRYVLRHSKSSVWICRDNA